MNKLPNTFFILIIFLISNYSCTEGNKSGKLTTEALYLSNWKTVNLPNSTIKMSIPFDLIDKNLSIPSQVKTVITSLKSKDYKLGSEFYFLMGFIKYTSDELSLTNAANQAMENLKRQNNVSKVLYREKGLKIAGIAAISQTGTYTENVRDLEFDNLTFIKGENMWSIIITNKTSNVYGRKIRERIVKSIIEN